MEMGRIGADRAGGDRIAAGAQMRQRETEWGFVVAPGDLPPCEGSGTRRVRFGQAALLLAMAAGAAGAAMAGVLSPGVAVLITLPLGMAGLCLLVPRRAPDRVEIEVDVVAREIRVIECRGDERTIHSREPLGALRAIEIGGVIVPLQPAAP